MALTTCPIGHREDGNINSQVRPHEATEVTLNILSAATCTICAFAYDVFNRDDATPKSDSSSYHIDKIRVDDTGLIFSGQWQGSLVVELYGIDASSTLPVPKNVPPVISIDYAAKMINKWMKECGSQTHESCNASSPVPTDIVGQEDALHNEPQTVFPRRLIRLAAEGLPAQLVDNLREYKYPYAALSYCWGAEGTFMTVDDTVQETLEIAPLDHTLTLAEAKREIPFDKLPSTLKDVFILAKEIGFKHLWVDAICIVQGNPEEWEDESRRMGNIYSNAQLVISATRSENVQQGLFLPRSAPSIAQDVISPGGVMSARRNLNHEIMTSCRTRSDRWWEANINKTFPLLGRGWGFQERLLAARTVHFTPTELVWECLTTRMCECGIMDNNLNGPTNNMFAAFRLFLSLPLSDRSTRQMWREIVWSYSVRRLTKIEDKLPALSGIASRVQQKTGDIYVAGLWKRSLPFDLLWRRDQSGALRAAKREPTWSWTSVDGAVTWPVSTEIQPEQPLKFITSTTFFEHSSKGVEVCEVGCSSDGQNPYGEVKSGYVKLKTRLASVRVEPIADEYWVEYYTTKWALRVDQSKLAPFWPDIDLEGQQGRLYVLEVIKFAEGPGTWEEALVVRLRGTSSSEYERVGVAANVSSGNSWEWMTTNSWFDSEVEASEITLI